jgi:predicted transcriptional regulator of viral defense system
MKWRDLLAKVGREPVFRASLLEVGGVSAPELRVQLSRWVSAGRLVQLRRGVYALAGPHRQTDPHPFLIAQSLRQNAYVSLQSALAYHGLIPEHVPTVTCVTTGRSERIRTDLGSFVLRHISTKYFFGYRETEVARGQHAFVAFPEKALLDLVYLTPGGHRADFMRELRLDRAGALDREVLADFVDRFQKPKLRRALRALNSIIQSERQVNG